MKVVRPKRDPNFRITTLLPVAKVEPYYQAGLRARVSGVVQSVAKDIGEPVRAGELLVEIDVPDLKQAVEQKDAIIVQREKELAAAAADVAVAKSAVEAAAVAVKVKGVEVNRAKDTLSARKIDLDGVTILFKKGVGGEVPLRVRYPRLPGRRAGGRRPPRWMWRRQRWTRRERPQVWKRRKPM